MSQTDLARQLAAARQQRSQIDPTLLDILRDEADAYRVQALAIRHYPSTHIGYKVGATNETSQNLLGCDGPFFGPLFDAECHDAGITIDAKQDIIGGEAEFAFLIDRDIPPDTELQITDYIQAAHIAVELIGRRTVGLGLPTALAAIADFGGNAAFIRGNSIDNWQTIDFATIEVIARIDGEETNSGNGAAVLGNPLNSLLWLHQTLSQQGQTLKAGQWVTTGTCLGVIQPKPGSQVVVSFAGCGEIDYHLR